MKNWQYRPEIAERTERNNIENTKRIKSCPIDGQTMTSGPLLVVNYNQEVVEEAEWWNALVAFQ